jgi:hypothetical protein
VGTDHSCLNTWNSVCGKYESKMMSCKAHPTRIELASV